MSRHIHIVVFVINLVYTVIQSALIAIIDYNFIVVLIYFICVLPQCVCVWKISPLCNIEYTIYLDTINISLIISQFIHYSLENGHKIWQ